MPIFDSNDREIVRILDNQGREIETVYDQNGIIVYTKIREITGNLPLSFTSLVDKNLTDYIISGETLQNGTPSPDYPVDVQGVGERTENLNDGMVLNYAIMAANGLIVYNYASGADKCFCMKISKNKTYSVVNFGQASYFWYGITLNPPSNQNENPLKYGSINGEILNDTIGEYLWVFVGRSNAPLVTVVEGSIAPTSHIPYGYKLPITVNGTEYPIYLGQVPTTRRIGKKIFDGTEAFAKYGNSFAFAFPQLTNCSSLYTWSSYPGSYCNIVRSRSAYAMYVNPNQPGISIRNDEMQKQNIISLGYQIELADFKAYLAAQYANGTPVTVWYVLAEPETGIVNEPLMRIGEYADTISFAQAGVTIPTVSGDNVLDMTSAVKPSEVYIKGKSIKPDGYGKLVDANGVYIFDKNGVQLTVHGQGTSN